jgi:hypothetical protein
LPDQAQINPLANLRVARADLDLDQPAASER